MNIYCNKLITSQLN